MARQRGAVLVCALLWVACLQQLATTQRTSAPPIPSLPSAPASKASSAPSPSSTSTATSSGSTNTSAGVTTSTTYNNGTSSGLKNSTSTTSTSSSVPSQVDVLVIGAGMSGLAAARKLHDAGFSTLIVEAGSRIGGRMHTINFTTQDMPIDRGATWLHGPSSANPIVNITNSNSIQTIPVVDEQSWYQGGEELNDTSIKTYYDTFQQFRDYIQQWQSNGNGTDTSLAFQMQTFLRKNAIKAGPLQDALYAHLNTAVEQEYAASATNLSALYFNQDSQFSPDDNIVPNGWIQVANAVAQGLRIQLSTPVSSIDYGGEQVAVTTSKGTVRATAVVFTPSLGVLKNGDITFEPQLPEPKVTAIDNLGFGVLDKIILVFDQSFWPDDVTWFYNIVANGTSDMCNEWFNYGRYVSKPILICFNAGKTAVAAAEMSEQRLTTAAVNALKDIFGIAVPAPVEAISTRWGKEKYFYGSYSYMALGSMPDDYDSMARPVAGKLFFAGEATNRRYPGTVHGAFISGERAADEAMEALVAAGVTPKPFPPPPADLSVAAPSTNTTGAGSGTVVVRTTNVTTVRRSSVGCVRAGAMTSVVATLVMIVMLVL